MPEKRKGLTQVSLQIPDPLLAAAHVKRGDRSLNVYVCELLATDTGAAFEPRGRGRPKKTEAAPPKKAKSKSAKKPARKPKE